MTDCSRPVEELSPSDWEHTALIVYTHILYGRFMRMYIACVDSFYPSI